MVPSIDAAISTWPLPKTEQDGLIAQSEDKPLSQMTVSGIEERIVEDLGQHPFGDVGRERQLLTWGNRIRSDLDQLVSSVTW
jgi:hypothetical protein